MFEDCDLVNQSSASLVDLIVHNIFCQKFYIAFSFANIPRMNVGYM